VLNWFHQREREKPAKPIISAHHDAHADAQDGEEREEKRASAEIMSSNVYIGTPKEKKKEKDRTYHVTRNFFSLG